LRMSGGFNLVQIVSEFRALRASVTSLWEKQLTEVTARDVKELNRFHQSIDQLLAESVSHYAGKIAAAKDLTSGILTNDLSNALSTIMESAGLVSRIGQLHERQAMLTAQIIESTARATETVGHLVDLTRARFGSGLPVRKEWMDLGFITRQVVDEVRTMHPSRDFKVDISGNLEGQWDRARLGQVLTNLLGNATRFGFKDSLVSVKVEGTAEEVVLSVHDEGAVISPAVIDKIFDSLNRVQAQEGNSHSEGVNLGLGLYITKEIIDAHDGTIGVTSSEKSGTTFVARLPRTSTDQDSPTR
jgi:K+-sensing histidine kinase KdpD